MSRFKLLDRLRGSVLAGSVGTSASEEKLLSSRESHPGVIPDYPGLSRIKTFDRAQRIMFREQGIEKYLGSGMIRGIGPVYPSCPIANGSSVGEVHNDQ